MAQGNSALDICSVHQQLDTHTEEDNQQAQPTGGHNQNLEVQSHQNKTRCCLQETVAKNSAVGKGPLGLARPIRALESHTGQEKEHLMYQAPSKDFNFLQE